MKLLVDGDIVGADTAFAALGDVRLFRGRDLHAGLLADAEALIVRSVSRVDGELLRGSQVRYVGTTTAGTDHVDTAALAAAGIRFNAAPGCNARAVAEHVACCLAAYSRERGLALSALTVGIVGYGHVGRAVGTMLQHLGCRFVVNDPPLGANIAGVTTAPLADLLRCDVVTVHVPYTTSGAHPSANLLDAGALERLRPGALLINAARGGVINEAAFCARTAQGGLLGAIDCWRGEPSIAPDTLAAAWRASPHIAGHTLEARINAVRMQQVALAAWAGVPAPAAPPVAPLPAVLAPKAADDLSAVLEMVHPLVAHTRRLRDLQNLPAAAIGAEFDRQRAQFGLRREFASHRIAHAGLSADTVALLRALDFALV